MATILTFNKITDVDDIFQAEINEVPNIRITAGGIKVLSNGSWSKIQPYVDKPSPADTITRGKALIYRDGLIINFDDETNGYLAQIAKTFLLIRCLRGTVTIPKIDGYLIEHNGTDTDTEIQLSAGQYALFYKDTKPTVGSYLTSDVENGSGHKVNLITLDGTSLSFYLNLGYGESYIDYSTSKWGMKYSDNEVRPPTLPILFLTWSKRDTYAHAQIMYVPAWLGAVPYIDDPNTTTNQVLDRVPRRISAGEEDNWFYFGVEVEYHDSSRTHRFTVRHIFMYYYDSENDIWKIRNMKKLVTVTTIHNYDEAGLTTAYGARVGVGTWNEDENHDILDDYYGYKDGVGWEALAFSSTDYTWRTGYKATRIQASFYGLTVYIYTKYFAKGGSISLNTYKHARYYTSAWLNHYFDDFADIDIDAGNVIALAIESWCSPTEQYEADPPSETDYGTDTFFVDKYFRLSSKLTLNIIVR